MNRRALYSVVMAYSLIVAGVLLGVCALLRLVVIVGAFLARYGNRLRGRIFSVVKKVYQPFSGFVRSL